MGARSAAGEGALRWRRHDTRICARLAAGCCDVECARKGRAARVRQLFDRESLAEYLRLSTDTIDRLVNAGRLPCVRIGSHVRSTLEDVDAFVEHHRRLGSVAS